MSAFLLPCTSGLLKARTMAGVPSHMGNEQPLPDELRCRRCDGKRWRCCGRRLDGVKYCEYHYNKMRIFYERVKGSAKRREGEISSTSSKKERASSDHVETKVQKEKKRFKRVLSLVDKPEGSSVKKLKTDNLLERNKVIRSVNKHSTLYGMTIVRPYCFKWPGIYVPVRFAKANGLFNRNCDMEVLDEAGDYWPVKLWAKPYDGQAYIRHGWNDFQQAHGLKIGDEVRFELIKGEEKPILKCCIQRLGSPAAVGELKDCQPLDHGQEVHAESSSSRPQLFSSVQAVDKLLEKEKIAQPCHGSCAAVSKAHLSKEKVTGEIVLERHSSLPVIDCESLDQNSCQAHSSHSEAMDEVGRRSVTKEVHAKSSRARRQLSFGQAVKMQSKKEKIAQLHHDSCATASKGHPSKEMVTGEIVLERPCSLPIIEVESLDGNAAEPQSSHTELVDEAGGRSVLKAPLPYTNSEHPAPPGDSPAQAAQDGNSIGSFPLAIPHGYGQSKVCTFQSGAEVEKTITPVLFETPSAMMIHNSPADNSIERVDLAEGESKVVTSQSGTEVEKTITSVLYETPTVMRAYESPADYPIVRVELADGENKVLTSQSGKEVEKTITAALFKTPSAMRVYNSPADNPIDSPVDGQNKAPTSQCGTEVDKIISPDLLETLSAMRIYNSPADNPAKRVEPIDGQSSAPTSECDIEDEKTMLETPLGPIRYNFLTDDPAERVKPIVNMSDTSSSILEAIVSKHGDIGAGCTLKSSIVKSALLGSISNVALELHNMKPDDIQSSRLEEFYSAIQDAEGVKIDVNWLRRSLDKISKMKELIKTSEKFEDEELRSREKAKSYRMILQTKRGKIEELQSMIEELQSEVRDAKSKLESENLRIDKLRGTIERIKSRSRQVVRII